MSNNYIENTSKLMQSLAILAVCILVWMGISAFKQADISLFGPSKSELKAQVESQAKDIVALQETVAKLDRVIELQAELNKTMVDAVTESAAEQRKVETKLTQQTAKLEKKLGIIKADPGLTEPEKDTQTSALIFDSIEEARCSHITQSCYKEVTT